MVCQQSGRHPMTKRLPWRCKNAKQAKDKAIIYNSKQWQELRIQKLRANPLCQECEKQGIVRSAHCVHHIVPIETATSMDEMRRLAFCGLDGLLSLCDECHARIHKDEGSHTKQAVQQRQTERHERWKDRLLQRFASSDRDSQHPDPETPAASF